MIKSFIKKHSSKIVIFFLIIILANSKSVLADSIIDIHNFEFELAPGGGRKELMDTENKMKVGYIKVDVDTEDGDKYDVSLKYSKNYLKSTKTFATKKGLTAKGVSSTIYFIPKDGRCPGKNNECVRVPIIKGISTSTQLIDSTEVFYGIELYNGSAFGKTMKVKGSYAFIKYEDEEKID